MKEITLDQPVTNGDGILLGHTSVWVVRNQLNQVVEVKLDPPPPAAPARS